MNSSLGRRAPSRPDLVDDDVLCRAPHGGRQRAAVGAPDRRRSPIVGARRVAVHRRGRDLPAAVRVLGRRATGARGSRRARQQRDRHESRHRLTLPRLCPRAPSTTGPLDRRFSGDARPAPRSSAASPRRTARATPASTSSRSTARSPTAPRQRAQPRVERRSCRACLPAARHRARRRLRRYNGPRRSGRLPHRVAARRRSPPARRIRPIRQRPGRLLRQPLRRPTPAPTTKTPRRSTAAPSPSRRSATKTTGHAVQPRARARRQVTLATIDVRLFPGDPTLMHAPRDTSRSARSSATARSLACADTKEAIVVDPGGEHLRILEIVRHYDLTVKWIIHTHAHLDHIYETRDVKEAAGGTIALHKDDLFLYDGFAMQAAMFGWQRAAGAARRALAHRRRDAARSASARPRSSTRRATRRGAAASASRRRRRPAAARRRHAVSAIDRPHRSAGRRLSRPSSDRSRSRIYTLDPDTAVIPRPRSAHHRRRRSAPQPVRARSLMIRYPDRIERARLPTPVEPARRLSHKLGVELLVKRDDLTGSSLSGNKIRKLEFLLRRRRRRKAPTPSSPAAASSRTTAAPPPSPPPSWGCARTCCCAPTIRRSRRRPRPTSCSIGSSAPRSAGSAAKSTSGACSCSPRCRGSCWRSGARPTSFPRAARTPSAPGATSAASRSWPQELGDEPLTLVYAAGSGGTGAGLILGIKLLEPALARRRHQRLRRQGLLRRRPSARSSKRRSRSGICRSTFDRSEIEIVDGYVGVGYAKSRPEELQTIRDVARTEGLILDPVYTGKAFHGMAQELARDPERVRPARLLHPHRRHLRPVPQGEGARAASMTGAAMTRARLRRRRARRRCGRSPRRATRWRRARSARRG